MKKILIVDKEMEDLAKKNSKIVVKKGISIIKDMTLMTESFINSLDVSYKYQLESWEIFDKGNSIRPERIYMISALDGSRLKPVHVISHKNPFNGSKCLFQFNNCLQIKIQSGVFELSKHDIDAKGLITHKVLKVGEYENLTDIKTQVPNNVVEMVESLLDKYEWYKESYQAPLYADVK